MGQLTVKMTVRTVSSYPAVRTASWWALDALASSARMNLVPTQIAWAPIISAAARELPRYIAPAATTITSWPVNGDFFPLHKSTTWGISIEVGTSPVWPPLSPPCAQIMSTPDARHFATCLGCPTMFIYGIPARWILSTTCGCGTPTAETNNEAFSSITMSMSWSSFPFE